MQQSLTNGVVRKRAGGNASLKHDQIHSSQMESQDRRKPLRAISIPEFPTSTIDDYSILGTKASRNDNSSANIFRIIPSMPTKDERRARATVPSNVFHCQSCYIHEAAVRGGRSLNCCLNCCLVGKRDLLGQKTRVMLRS